MFNYTVVEKKYIRGEPALTQRQEKPGDCTHYTRDPSTPRYFPKINENILSHKNLYTNVCGSLTLGNSPKLETTKHGHHLPREWINKLWYLLNNEDSNMGESQKH